VNIDVFKIVCEIMFINSYKEEHVLSVPDNDLDD
jgi:hypothetical protein